MLKPIKRLFTRNKGNKGSKSSGINKYNPQTQLDSRSPQTLDDSQNQQSEVIYGQKYINIKLTKNLKENLATIKGAMNNNYDIKTKEFKLGGRGVFGAVVYIPSLADEDFVLNHIVNPLMIQSSLILDREDAISFDTIKDTMIDAEYINEAESLDQILFSVMSGDTFLSVQGYPKGLIISTKGYVGRQVSEPQLEPSVKGSQEGFTEILQDNIGLLRRRIRDPNLVFEVYKVGQRTQMEVVIAYLRDVADQGVAIETAGRLSSLDVDGIQGTAELGLYITDNPNSIFPLYQVTERPDRVARGLMEGRVAIFMEGGAEALVVPATMPILLQSADDYYENWIVSSLLRLLRYGGMLISIFLPSLYIALAGHHPGMLPTKLVLTITGARTGVPFPGFLEAVIMGATLELLQEASIRLPRVIGQAVSIVGGLVIGQAAVQAGLVGPIMVIIIGVTAIGSFVVTDYSLGLATRVLRIPFMILALTLGGFGLALGALVLITYMADLESFGIRYIKPLSPYRIRDLKQTILKARDASHMNRPAFLNTADVQRQTKQRRGK
ncbi:MAG: spore germination protein [Clostridiales bacterium]|nr:spore germination protein [Clostridiales bacterium]